MANDNKLVNLADLKEAFNTLKTNASQSAAGLMSASDKAKLDGIAAGAQVNPGNVTTSAAGLMSASDKTKLDGIAAGAQVNSITGVKGNSESSYRTGNVNLTPANIGAIPTSSIINNLTSGGTTVPLSAEMGKQLNTSLSNFRPNQLKRRWIFIGDSYGHASGTNNGWIDKLVTMMGLSSNDYYESGIGGAGFATTSVEPFLNMITTLASDITDKNSITDIVVLGGANDLAKEASDVSAAIESFNAYCKDTFPNAKVYIGYISGCADPSLVGPQYSRVKEGYSQCGTATYLNNLEYVFQNRAYLGSDKIHPTATGYTVLTKKIYEALNGGCNVVYRDIGVSLSYPAGSEAGTSTQKATIIVNNGITDIWFAGRINRYAAQSSGYFNISNDSTICFVDTNLILPASSDIGLNYNPFSVPMHAKVRSTINNTYYLVNGFALLTTDSNTGKVKLSFLPQDPQISQTSAFTSCSEIEISGYHVSCASILC